MPKFIKAIPLYDWVLVKRSTPKTTSPGGVILPDKSVEKTLDGVVVAVGPGKRDQNGNLLPMTVKCGDTVLLRQYGGAEVEVNGEKYHFMAEGEIFAVLEEIEIKPEPQKE